MPDYTNHQIPTNVGKKKNDIIVSLLRTVKFTAIILFLDRIKKAVFLREKKSKRENTSPNWPFIDSSIFIVQKILLNKNEVNFRSLSICTARS